MSPLKAVIMADPLLGMDCYADDREALMGFERFFNSSSFSDVTLLVGDEMFYAHRIMLIKSSEVFGRMLSQQWNGDKKEIELVEDRVCAKVFPAFLRFLYCNHVTLHSGITHKLDEQFVKHQVSEFSMEWNPNVERSSACDNALPLLILADKYNVDSLRKVCLNYAVNHILPSTSLKDIFHVWFQYGTKCFHQPLINCAISILSPSFQELALSSEWEKEWLSLDRDQITEFLKCSDLHIANEYEVWQAVQRWIQAPAHPERRGTFAEKNLSQIVPLIRFAFLTSDELSQLESCQLVQQYPKLFQPQILMAYKWHALALGSRAGCREFSGTQFLLRNYTELRWDKRLVIPDVSFIPKYTEVALKVLTRASALPTQSWEWELKIHPRGFSSANDDFRCILSSSVILDQTRAVEYMLSIVDDKKVLRSVVGKKTFSKTRYSADLEMEKKVSLEEIWSDNSPLLVNNNLHLQMILKPID